MWLYQLSQAPFPSWNSLSHNLHCHQGVIRIATSTYRPKGKAEPVVVYGVHVREAVAPRDESPVEWMLLTSMMVESVADAKRVLGMYVKRWRVEDFFRIL